MIQYNNDYYKILGLEYPSTPEEIKKTYYALAKINHPDRGGDVEMMKEINVAYNILGNADSKAKYDSYYQAQKINQNTYHDNTKENNDDIIITIYYIGIDYSVSFLKRSLSTLPEKYKAYINNNNEIYAYERMIGTDAVIVPTTENDYNENIFSISGKRIRLQT